LVDVAGLACQEGICPVLSLAPAPLHRCQRSPSFRFFFFRRQFSKDDLQGIFRQESLDFRLWVSSVCRRPFLGWSMKAPLFCPILRAIRLVPCGGSFPPNTSCMDEHDKTPTLSLVFATTASFPPVFSHIAQIVVKPFVCFVGFFPSLLSSSDPGEKRNGPLFFSLLSRLKFSLPGYQGKAGTPSFSPPPVFSPFHLDTFREKEGFPLFPQPIFLGNFSLRCSLLASFCFFAGVRRPSFSFLSVRHPLQQSRFQIAYLSSFFFFAVEIPDS